MNIDTDLLNEGKLLVSKINMSRDFLEQVTIIEELATLMIQNDVLLNASSFREIIPNLMERMQPFVPDENITFTPLLNTLNELIKEYINL